MERPIEKYMEQADELAQEVVNAWAMNVQAGHAKDLSDDFKALFELTCRYRTTRETADNRRQFNLLSAGEAANEESCRKEFVLAYKQFRERSEAKKERAGR
jgi:hypothetical protein